MGKTIRKETDKRPKRIDKPRTKWAFQELKKINLKEIPKDDEPE